MGPKCKLVILLLAVHELANICSVNLYDFSKLYQNLRRTIGKRSLYYTQVSALYPHFALLNCLRLQLVKKKAITSTDIRKFTDRKSSH